MLMAGLLSLWKFFLLNTWYAKVTGELLCIHRQWKESILSNRTIKIQVISFYQSTWL
jgi:hypothetical protein